ncbi:MAG TPA: hypothetical protein VFV38_35110 [Ktedonobacteraceae bacterium]|nr:hypothetical protein [Ktedonobacteraceae bacterium]
MDSQHTIRKGIPTAFADIWRWAKEWEQLHARIAPHFARPQPRREEALTGVATLRLVIGTSIPLKSICKDDFFPSNNSRLRFPF